MQLLNQLDKQVFEWLILNMNPEWLTSSSEIIGKLTFLIIPFVIFNIAYSIINPKNYIKFLLLSILLLVFSEVLASFLKAYFQRPRPSVQMGIVSDKNYYSFPSAHALNSMAIFTFCAFWFPSAKKICITLAIIIGLSRVFSNYHFPLDVIFGWFVGYMLANIFYRLTLLLFDKDHCLRFEKHKK